MNTAISGMKPFRNLRVSFDDHEQAQPRLLGRQEIWAETDGIFPVSYRLLTGLKLVTQGMSTKVIVGKAHTLFSCLGQGSLPEGAPSVGGIWKCGHI